MANNDKKYVKVSPQNKEACVLGFESNAKPGDRLIYQSSKTMDSPNLPKRVVVVDETPFNLRVDMGGYTLSVNKASIFCRKDILYFERRIA